MSVDISWDLPSEFSFAGAPTRVVLGGIKATAVNATSTSTVTAIAGPGLTSRTDIWVFGSNDRVITFAPTGVSYPPRSSLVVDAVHGSDIPDGAGEICTGCDPLAGCASLKCAVTQALRVVNATTLELVVKPGLYTGPSNIGLSLKGAPIAVKADEGAVLACTGSDSGPALVFESGETASSVVVGLRIANCSTDGNGGGVWIETSAPTLQVGSVAGLI